MMQLNFRKFLHSWLLHADMGYHGKGCSFSAILFFLWPNVMVLFYSEVLCYHIASKSCRLFLPNIPAVCFPVYCSVKLSSSLPLRNIFSAVLSIQNLFREIIFRVTDCHTDHVFLCPSWRPFSGAWNISILP